MPYPQVQIKSPNRSFYKRTLHSLGVDKFQIGGACESGCGGKIESFFMGAVASTRVSRPEARQTTNEAR